MSKRTAKFRLSWMKDGERDVIHITFVHANGEPGWTNNQGYGSREDVYRAIAGAYVGMLSMLPLESDITPELVYADVMKRIKDKTIKIVGPGNKPKPD